MTKGLPVRLWCCLESYSPWKCTCLMGADRLFRETQGCSRLYKVPVEKREVKMEQKFKSSKSFLSPYKIKEHAKLVRLIIRKE